MGSKRLDSIDRFARYGFALGVECRSCGHKAKLDARQIAEQAIRLGLSRNIAAIERRLRCSGCKARNVRIEPAFTEAGASSLSGQPVNPANQIAD